MSPAIITIERAVRNFVHRTGTHPTNIYLGYDSYRELFEDPEARLYWDPPHSLARDGRRKFRGLLVFAVDTDQHLALS